MMQTTEEAAVTAFQKCESMAPGEWQAFGEDDKTYYMAVSPTGIDGYVSAIAMKRRDPEVTWEFALAMDEFEVVVAETPLTIEELTKLILATAMTNRQIAEVGHE